jgi:hypothetical protein
MHSLWVIVTAGQMDMGIDHPWHQSTPSQVDDAIGIAWFRDIIATRHDLLTLDQHAAPFDQSSTPVDDATASQV